LKPILLLMQQWGDQYKETLIEKKQAVQSTHKPDTLSTETTLAR
jgi:hypothetical protein